jgi:hypothetical protein
VAVEKLSRRKFAETASRQEALQTIFRSRLDIFHHPIFDFFQKNRLFQQPQALLQGTPECAEGAVRSVPPMPELWVLFEGVFRKAA